VAASDPPNDLSGDPHLDSSLHRTIDANANRASEGLRVLEDFVRYWLDDHFLTSQLKSLRHDLDATLGDQGRLKGLPYRDTLGDVGTQIEGKLEYQRTNAIDLVLANFKRLQQALRSLEEHLKLNCGDASSKIEAIRYRSYTLEKAVINTFSASQAIPEVAIYVLVDGCESEAKLKSLIESILPGQPDYIQLRDKQLSDRELLHRAKLLVELCRPTPTQVVVNDRPDLAKLSGADGVHVGQEELSVADCRKILGPGKLVGLSTHNIEQARRAVLDGANYIGVGPTFPSQTKHFAQFPGTDFIQQVAEELSLPAFAIGGIDLSNVEKVRDAGLRRIAVSSCIQQSAHPSQTINELRKLTRSRA